MLKKLPIALIALSFLSTSSFAGTGWGSGTSSGSVTGASAGSGSGSSGWSSKPGSGSDSESREDEFHYYRIDCRYHGGDHDDDHGSGHGSDHGSDGKSGKMGDRLTGKLDDKLADKGKVYDGDYDRDSGGRFCYGSAVYRITDHEVRDIHLAIGCDNRTIFNEDARLHTEMTLDRFQPFRAATPAIEVFPHGQLGTEGTYTSVLDISYGRMKGLCYVHPVKYDSIARKY